MTCGAVRLSSFMVAIVVAAAASAQTVPSRTSGQARNGEQQVKAAQEQMLQAAKAGDKDGVAALLADDVSWVDRTGHVADKQGMLNTLPAPVRSVDVDHVQVMGNTACLTGVAHLNDGQDTRFLQEWVNRDGKWKLMAHQGAPIVAPGAAAAAPPSRTSVGTAGRSEGASPESHTVAPVLTSPDERAVWQSQTDIIEAYAKGEVDAYDKLTSTSFMRIDTDGQFFTKSQWLDLVRKNEKQPVKPGVVNDVQIHVDNDVARVTLTLVPFKADGTREPAERQTRILAKRDGRWQQVAAISTRLDQ